MDITRRRFLIGAAGSFTVAAGLGGTTLVAHAADGDLVLVENGEARAQVVVPAAIPTADRALVLGAADLLVATVAGITGVTLLRTDAEPVGLVPVYVGHAGAASPAGFSVAGLPRDGFAVEVTTRSVTLAGPSASGTWMAALHVTEQLGVGYCLPGTSGTAIPPADAAALPVAGGRHRPTFADRAIWAYGTAPELNSSLAVKRYGARLKLMMQARYSHNMTLVYPSARYGQTLPEIYPVRGGVRHIPPVTSTLNANWNPRWQDPVTVAPAVEYAVAQLTAANATGWVSMGMNDNGGYSDDTVALGEIDGDGLFSLSGVYCTWLNQVAAGVEQQLGHRDFRIGFLAYNDIRSAPAFDLHPTLVPFITRDLFGWNRPDLAEHDRKLVDTWASRAASLGWWDYPWGTPIMVPRLYHRTQQRALQYLRDRHVVGVFAEMDQNLGDGAKAALYAQLLWDVDLDVDAALDRWCRQTAGDAGAPHLKAYDQLWNDFWTTVMPTTEYASSGKGMSYFWYMDTDYLNRVPDALVDTSKGHLEAAAAAATTDAQRERISVIARQHEYHRSSVLSYDRDQPVPANVGEALQQLRRAVADFDRRREHARRREELITQFRTDPMLRHTHDPLTSGLVWDGSPLKVMWDVGMLMRSEPRRGRGSALWAHVDQLVAEHPNPGIRDWVTVLRRIAEGHTVNRAANGDFAADTVAPWTVDTASGWPGGEPQRVTDVRREGPGSLRVVGPTTGGGIWQMVDVEPGFLRSSFWFRATPADNLMGCLTNTWLLFDAAGVRVGLMRGETRALETDAGQWREITQLRMLPDNVAKVACYLSYFRFAQQTEVHVADISYTQVMAVGQ